MSKEVFSYNGFLYDVEIVWKCLDHLIEHSSKEFSSIAEYAKLPKRDVNLLKVVLNKLEHSLNQSQFAIFRCISYVYSHFTSIQKSPMMPLSKERDTFVPDFYGGRPSDPKIHFSDSNSQILQDTTQDKNENGCYKTTVNNRNPSAEKKEKVHVLQDQGTPVADSFKSTSIGVQHQAYKKLVPCQMQNFSSRQSFLQKGSTHSNSSVPDPQGKQLSRFSPVYPVRYVRHTTGSQQENDSLTTSTKPQYYSNDTNKNSPFNDKTFSSESATLYNATVLSGMSQHGASTPQQVLAMFQRDEMNKKNQLEQYQLQQSKEFQNKPVIQSSLSGHVSPPGAHHQSKEFQGISQQSSPVMIPNQQSQVPMQAQSMFSTHQQMFANPKTQAFEEYKQQIFLRSQQSMSCNDQVHQMSQPYQSQNKNYLLPIHSPNVRNMQQQVQPISCQKQPFHKLSPHDMQKIQQALVLQQQQQGNSQPVMSKVLLNNGTFQTNCSKESLNPRVFNGFSGTFEQTPTDFRQVVQKQRFAQNHLATHLQQQRSAQLRQHQLNQDLQEKNAEQQKQQQHEKQQHLQQQQLHQLHQQHQARALLNIRPSVQSEHGTDQQVKFEKKHSLNQPSSRNPEQHGLVQHQFLKTHTPSSEGKSSVAGNQHFSQRQQLNAFPEFPQALEKSSNYNFTQQQAFKQSSLQQPLQNTSQSQSQNNSLEQKQPSIHYSKPQFSPQDSFPQSRVVHCKDQQDAQVRLTQNFPRPQYSQQSFPRPGVAQPLSMESMNSTIQQQKNVSRQHLIQQRLVQMKNYLLSQPVNDRESSQHTYSPTLPRTSQPMYTPQQERLAQQPLGGHKASAAHQTHASHQLYATQPQRTTQLTRPSQPSLPSPQSFSSQVGRVTDQHVGTQQIQSSSQTQGTQPPYASCHQQQEQPQQQAPYVYHQVTGVAKGHNSQQPTYIRPVTPQNESNTDQQHLANFQQRGYLNETSEKKFVLQSVNVSSETKLLDHEYNLMVAKKNSNMLHGLPSQDPKETLDYNENHDKNRMSNRPEPPVSIEPAPCNQRSNNVSAVKFESDKSLDSTSDKRLSLVSPQNQDHFSQTPYMKIEESSNASVSPRMQGSGVLTQNLNCRNNTNNKDVKASVQQAAPHQYYPQTLLNIPSDISDSSRECQDMSVTLLESHHGSRGEQPMQTFLSQDHTNHKVDPSKSLVYETNLNSQRTKENQASLLPNQEASRDFEKRNFQGIEGNGTIVQPFPSSAECQKTLYNRDVGMRQILNSRVSDHHPMPGYSTNQVPYIPRPTSSCVVSGSNSLIPSDYMLSSPQPALVPSHTDSSKSFCVLQKHPALKKESSPSQANAKTFLTSLTTNHVKTLDYQKGKTWNDIGVTPQEPVPMSNKSYCVPVTNGFPAKVSTTPELALKCQQNFQASSYLPYQKVNESVEPSTEMFPSSTFMTPCSQEVLCHAQKKPYGVQAERSKMTTLLTKRNLPTERTMKFLIERIFQLKKEHNLLDFVDIEKSATILFMFLKTWVGQLWSDAISISCKRVDCPPQSLEGFVQDNLQVVAKTEALIAQHSTEMMAFNKSTTVDNVGVSESGSQEKSTSRFKDELKVKQGLKMMLPPQNEKLLMRDYVGQIGRDPSVMNHRITHGSLDALKDLGLKSSLFDTLETPSTKPNETIEMKAVDPQNKTHSEAELRAKEINTVRRKQGKLTRQVNVQDLITVLESEKFLVPLSFKIQAIKFFRTVYNNFFPETNNAVNRVHAFHERHLLNCKPNMNYRSNMKNLLPHWHSQQEEEEHISSVMVDDLPSSLPKRFSNIWLDHIARGYSKNTNKNKPKLLNITGGSPDDELSQNVDDKLSNFRVKRKRQCLSKNYNITQMYNSNENNNSSSAYSKYMLPNSLLQNSLVPSTTCLTNDSLQPDGKKANRRTSDYLDLYPNSDFNLTPANQLPFFQKEPLPMLYFPALPPAPSSMNFMSLPHPTKFSFPVPSIF